MAQPHSGRLPARLSNRIPGLGVPWGEHRALTIRIAPTSIMILLRCSAGRGCAVPLLAQQATYERRDLGPHTHKINAEQRCSPWGQRV